MEYEEKLANKNIYQLPFLTSDYESILAKSFKEIKERERISENSEYLSLKKDIADLRGLIINREVEYILNKPVSDISPILTVAKNYKPSKIVKVRIITLMITSILAGILLTIGFSKIFQNLWEGLYYISLSIPALGITTACITTLFVGEAYDQSKK